MRLCTAVIIAGVIIGPLVGGVGYAQTPATPAPDVVPEAMPFDIPYGTPIGLDQAQTVIAAAATEAKKHNWKMSISVVDPAGFLVAHATMDGNEITGLTEVSQAKARTSALFRRPSGVFQTAVNTGGAPSALSILNPDPCSGERRRVPDCRGWQADRSDWRQRRHFHPGCGGREGRAGGADGALTGANSAGFCFPGEEGVTI